MASSPTVSAETRLQALLLQWEEDREQGRERTPEELCGDDTALVDELRRRIDALRCFPSATPSKVTHLQTPGQLETPAAAGAQIDYRDLRLHARGGLGMVFEAHDAALGRRVALKFIRPEYADLADSQRRFLAEAEVTGRLEHPGIVPVYALGRDATGRPCYAMRFVQGVSLEQAVQTF